ncbi:DUF861 domain-containing protein [Acidisoma cellulosilytica]|uniref:DUF861 domain-containing protein n=1 Tax=Acidisoma cellulosilyticum TaxID=2802395 RepID=A0A963Z6I5_9PROT|nr:cupin domain-containing protein [Acidisoma cellulosilyticum]MCB8883720.1 DUF861 domain-containing protein [Acidisoma cellulosilyticum]
MTSLQIFDLHNLPQPVESRPSAERVMDGDPAFKTWELATVHDRKIRSGVWEASPGSYRSVKGGVFEYCTILSGLVELTEDGCDPVILGPGATFVMQPDFVGSWRTIETVRKLWVTVSP